MSAIDLIRSRWHSDITPQERAWLVDLLAAIREDNKRLVEEDRRHREAA